MQRGRLRKWFLRRLFGRFLLDLRLNHRLSRRPVLRRSIRWNEVHELADRDVVMNGPIATARAHEARTHALKRRILPSDFDEHLSELNRARVVTALSAPVLRLLLIHLPCLSTMRRIASIVTSAYLSEIAGESFGKRCLKT